MAFDLNLSYNTVLPSPKKKPIEEMGKTLDTLNAATAVNKTLYNQQLNAFNIQTPDPVAQQKIETKRNEFMSRMKDMIDKGDYAYMGRTLQDESQRLINDRYMQLAGTDAKEFEAQLNTKLRDNQKLNPTHAKVLVSDAMKNYSLQYDDETGVYRKAVVRPGYEQVDVNKQLVSLASALDANSKSGESLMYVGADGKTTTNISDADANIFIKSSSGDKYVDAPRLQKFMSKVLDNDTNMLGYLAQDYVIQNKDKYADRNLLDVVDDIVYGRDIEGKQAIIDKASNDLATTLAYNQGVSTEDISNMALHDRSGRNDKQPGTIYSTSRSVQFDAKNTNTPDNLGTAIGQTVSSLDATVSSRIPANSAGQRITKSGMVVDDKEFNTALNVATDDYIKGNSKSLDSLLSKFNLGSDVIENIKTGAENARTEYLALNQKKDNVKARLYTDPTNASLKPYIDFGKHQDNKDVQIITGLLANMGTNVTELREKYNKISDIENVQEYLKDRDKLSISTIPYSGFMLEPSQYADKSKDKDYVTTLKNVIDKLDGTFTSGDIGQLKKDGTKIINDMSKDVGETPFITTPSFAGIATTPTDNKNLLNAAYANKSKVIYNGKLEKLDSEDKSFVENSMPDQWQFRGIHPTTVVDGKYPAITFSVIQEPKEANKNKQKVVEVTIPMDETQGISTSTTQSYFKSSKFQAFQKVYAPLQWGTDSYTDDVLGFTSTKSGSDIMVTDELSGRTFMRDSGVDLVEARLAYKDLFTYIKDNNIKSSDIASSIKNYSSTGSDPIIDNIISMYPTLNTIQSKEDRIKQIASIAMAIYGETN